MDVCEQTHNLMSFETDKLDAISVMNQESIRIDSNEQYNKTNFGIPNDGSLDDGSNQEEPKQKLRTRNPENWKQNIRKRNKNKGLEYIKANGKICEKKKLGPPCTCKEKCYLKIGLDACQKIFQNFWKLGDHSLQNAYIAGCVRIFLPKHCYKKDGIPSRRFFSRNFHVTVNGVDTEVCKQAFLNMHAVSNGRLDRLLKKKQEIGNTGFDERGRHSNKVNKIPPEKIHLVRKHIDSIRQKAGYTGRRKPKKVELLPGVLNIRTMYRSYKEEMALKGLEPVCEYRYRKIFHSDFHLDFGKLAVCNDSRGSQKHQQPHKQNQDPDAFMPQSYLSRDFLVQRPIDKVCLKNISDKNVEGVTGVTLKDVNLNIQLKSNKEIPPYQQLGIQSAKELQIKSSDPTSYVLPQDVFRLDYTSNYSNSQQSWLFSSQH